MSPSKQTEKQIIQRAKVRKALDAALESGALARLHSRTEGAETLEGVVVEVGEKWLVLAQLTDGHEPDGWALVRLRDVRRVRTKRTNDVHRRILEARGQWPLPRPENLDLSSTRRLVTSLGPSHPVVGVHIERQRPDALWVGRVQGIEGRDLVIHGLDPEAVWENEPHHFGLRHLTRLTIGDGYTESLELIAAPEPRDHAQAESATT